MIAAFSFGALEVLLCILIVGALFILVPRYWGAWEVGTSLVIAAVVGWIVWIDWTEVARIRAAGPLPAGESDHSGFRFGVAIVFLVLAALWRIAWHVAASKENETAKELAASNLAPPDTASRSSAGSEDVHETGSRSTDFRFLTHALSAFFLLLLFWALPVRLAPDLANLAGAPLWRPPVAPTSPAAKSIDAGGTAPDKISEAKLAAPSIALADARSDKPQEGGPKSPFALAETLLVQEHTKAIAEIDMRIQHGDDWFHRKFVMIGGLVVAFLAALGSDVFKSFLGGGGVGTPAQDSPGYSRPLELDRRFGDIMRSNAACSLLALATAVAVGIDIQTKISDTVVQQIALWITHYVEPAFVGHPGPPPPGQSESLKELAAQLSPASPTSSSGSTNVAKPGAGLVPYERFLRIPDKGMHSDLIAKLLFHPHGYFLTWAIYLLYLTSFQKICFRAGNGSPIGLPITQQRIALSAFILVHFCLAAFAVITHSAPSGFELSLGGIQVPGNVCGWLFLIPWVLLVAVHRPYWLILVAGSRKNERDHRPKVNVEWNESAKSITWPVEGTAAEDEEHYFVLIQFRTRSSEKEEWRFLTVVNWSQGSFSDATTGTLRAGQSAYEFRAAAINSGGERGDWSRTTPVPKNTQPNESQDG